MNMYSALKNQGIIEETSGEYLLPDAYVDNDPRKPKLEIFYPPKTAEQIEEAKLFDQKILKRRFSNFTEGVNIFENLEHIDIDLMRKAPKDWKYVPPPNESELLALTTSIETIGLIHPIILQRDPGYDKYTIIDGESRAMALKRLNAKDPQDKYKYPLCVVLDSEKVDEYYFRSLIFDLNFQYRTIPQEIFIRMILERHTLLKKTKQFRNDANIAEKLAEEFMMSTSSIYNYLSLQKLTEEVMTLLFKKRISLRVARLFARVEHSVQLFILENIDFKEVNCYERIKYITGYGGKDLNKLKERIANSKDVVPDKIRFIVEINKKLLSKLSENFVDLKKYAISKFASAFRSDNIDKYCKVSFDKRFMKDYVAKNLIDETMLKKLGARKITDLYSKVSR